MTLLCTLPIILGNVVIYVLFKMILKGAQKSNLEKKITDEEFQSFQADVVLASITVSCIWTFLSIAAATVIILFY